MHLQNVNLEVTGNVISKNLLRIGDVLLKFVQHIAHQHSTDFR